MELRIRMNAAHEQKQIIRNIVIKMFRIESSGIARVETTKRIRTSLLERLMKQNMGESPDPVSLLCCTSHSSSVLFLFNSSENRYELRLFIYFNRIIFTFPSHTHLLSHSVPVQST